MTRQRRLRRAGLIAASMLALTCARPGPVAGPASATQQARDRARAEAEAGPEPESLKIPPPSGLATVPTVPATTTAALDNGFGVQVMERHGVPLVQLSLLVKSGRSSELDKTGVATLASELVKFGGAGRYAGSGLVDAFAAIGSELNIEVSSDWTLLSTAATREHWQTALSLLGALTQKPQLPLATFQALKQRASENAEALALSSDTWAMRLVLYRELFTAPTGVHSYARFDATSSLLAQVTQADCKAWLTEHLTPDNAELIVVGDVSADDVVERARSTFGSWQGKRTPGLAASRPTGPERLKVFVIDREARPQANILVGLLGAPRTSAAWPALAAATHLLGGSKASRLYVDLVENRGLAVRAASRLEPFAGGMPALIEVSAATETKRTEPTIEALLAQIQALGQTPPDKQELELATRSLVDGFLMRLGTDKALTGLLAERSSLQLRDDYFQEYREAVLDLAPDTLHETVTPYFDTSRAVVVVSGDAKALAKELSRFGPVEVVDAQKDFSTQRTVPHDPTLGH